MMAEWIDVKERLPEKDGMYLIFSPYTNKEGGIVYCNNFLTKGNPIFPPNSFESISKVTHWMPLPEPPAKACANSEMAIEILEFIKQEYEKNYQDAGVKKYIEALQMGVDALRVKKGLKNGE